MVNELFSIEMMEKIGEEKTRKHLQGVFGGNVVDIVFEKKDGTERKMRCTLMEEHLPEVVVKKEDTPKPKRKENLSVLPVYDLESDGWLSFQLSGLKEVNVVENWKPVEKSEETP